MDELEKTREVIARHWGYTSLRPQQEEAMLAELAGRDSLVVLPTGGGKSLCYQAPAVAAGRMTVVISPLISLMKDQVDSLRSVGIPALQIDSMQSEVEKREARQKIVEGKVPLLYVSPNRLLMSSFQDLLRQLDVRSFVVDEAHCISQWGLDFWPEYRQLSRIKELFPGASVHAYTATATGKVREDIAAQLRLSNPLVAVGDFDRPNLTYRIVPRIEQTAQAVEVITRHKGEAGIIYCIRKRDVDDLTAELRRRGYDAVAYHAGLSPSDRRTAQDRFSREECDLVVATVAFGMGIDRSNVRFVLHTGLPKSIEHYQQESGRAGRDGLAAECVMLYSGADVMLWRSILEKGAAERDGTPEALDASYRHLDDIDRFCRGAVCRHQALVEYFGQSLSEPSCEACDLCLGETACVADATTIAQKILSCVARVQQRFGIGHVIDVLRGAGTQRLRDLGHDKLSTFGLLKEYPQPTLRDWIYQLVAQGALLQERGEYPVLRLGEESREVLKGIREVRLVEMKRKERSQPESTDWNGVDRDLFESLRGLRREIAAERGVPPYIVFSDSVLRQLAAVRPSNRQVMATISGIGVSKLEQFSEPFLEAIRKHSHSRGLSLDQPCEMSLTASRRPPATRRPSAERLDALRMLQRGEKIAAVAASAGRTPSTVVEWLSEAIRDREISSIKPWVSDSTLAGITDAAGRVGTGRLKPIYLELGEKVSYDEIRIAVSFLEISGTQGEAG